MGDITGLLSITFMESKGNEKGRIHRAYSILRLFMTELEVNLLSSLHSSHTSGKKGIVRGRKKRQMKQGAIKLEKKKKPSKIDWTRD